MVGRSQEVDSAAGPVDRFRLHKVLPDPAYEAGIVSLAEAVGWSGEEKGLPDVSVINDHQSRRGAGHQTDFPFFGGPVQQFSRSVVQMAASRLPAGQEVIHTAVREHQDPVRVRTVAADSVENHPGFRRGLWRLPNCAPGSDNWFKPPRPPISAVNQ